MGDAHPAGDGKRFRPEIDEHHHDFAAVVGVDGAGCVQHRDAVMNRKARSRPHLPLETVRQGNRYAAWNKAALARLERQRRGSRNRRQEIKARRMHALIRRQREVGAVR